MDSKDFDKYSTLVNGSVETGVDQFSRYSSAHFQFEDAYIEVLKRPDGYSSQWLTEKSLSEIFTSLDGEYRPEEIITSVDHNGHSYWIDPDSWNGRGKESFIFLQIPYEGFRIEWRPFEVLTDDSEEIFSELTLVSNTEQFNTEKPLFMPAWKLHPHLSDDSVTEDHSQKVFNDIRFYLEDGL